MASPAAGKPSVFRFGTFELDAAAGELRKSGIPLKLHPQPFRVLLLLTERPGEVVTREEIQDCLWGNNTFVDFDRGINFCIRQIRATLADDAENPRYIETIPRRGYRFIATNGLFVAPKRSSPVTHAPVGAPEPAPEPRPTEVARGGEAAFKPDIHVVPSRIEPAEVQWIRKIPLTAVAVVLGAIVLAAAWGIFHVRGLRKLTEKDTVLLADFSNTTGDPVFDDALKQGLAVQLSQSPFLNILSDGTVQDTLKLMGRSPDERLTPRLAREVCRRTGNKAYFAGSIANLNSQYVIGLNLVNCETDSVLAREQVTANGKERVLKALDDAATRLRQKAGESLATLQKFDMPIEQATTSSLEALEAYSVGRRKMINGDPAGALAFFGHALQLDPDFAMAYSSLSTSYGKLGEDSLAGENAKKAYELRDRVSEREEFYIDSHYDYFCTGNLSKAREVYELWAATYPRDSVPVGNLGAIDRDLGNLEERLSDNLKAVQLGADGSEAYSSLASSYLALGRLDKAQEVIEEAQAKNLDSYTMRMTEYEIAFLQGDRAAMTKEVVWAMGKMGIEDRFLGAEALRAAYFGHMREARELWKRANQSAGLNDQKDAAAESELALALAEANFGNVALARKAVETALGQSKAETVEMNAGIVLAISGDSARAQEAANGIEKRVSENTIVQGIAIPKLRAAIEIRRGNAAKAIELLQPVAPYELGSVDGMYSAYLRGLAYLQLRDGAKAAGEFQRILGHRGVVLNRPIGMLAHLQLARAYAMQKDTGKARAEYQDLIALLKDADSDFGPLSAAKTENAKLN